MSVISSWPTAAGIHIHRPRGPEVVSRNPKVVKMPQLIEMKENPTANELNDFSVRSNCCL